MVKTGSGHQEHWVSGQPLSTMEVTQSHGLTEGENQREKSKVSLLPVSPYYTTPGCTRTHYLVRTDPMLRGPLTDSGCTYASYFTFAVTLEVKAEQSSNLRAEWSSEMGVERSSNSKSGAGRSSDLGVGWKLEQWKWEMGCPLTLDSLGSGCCSLSSGSSSASDPWDPNRCGVQSSSSVSVAEMRDEGWCMGYVQGLGH